MGLPSRSSREGWRKPKRCPPTPMATARQSSLPSTTRAKTGGKGIRTPDFQLAKLALYQLSYAPFELPSLDRGLRIANVSRDRACWFSQGRSLPTVGVSVVH